MKCNTWNTKVVLQPWIALMENHFFMERPYWSRPRLIVRTIKIVLNEMLPKSSLDVVSFCCRKAFIWGLALNHWGRCMLCFMKWNINSPDWGNGSVLSQMTGSSVTQGQKKAQKETLFPFSGTFLGISLGMWRLWICIGFTCRTIYRGWCWWRNIQLFWGY